MSIIYPFEIIRAIYLIYLVCDSEFAAMIEQGSNAVAQEFMTLILPAQILTSGITAWGSYLG